MLQRMRELTIQASNGTLTNADREMLDLEFQELKKEIQRISTNTEFNTLPLLDGSRTSLRIQAGANEGQSIEFSIEDMGIAAIGIDNTSIATQADAQSAITAIDQAMQNVSSERAKLGAYTNRLEHAYNNAVNMAGNLTDAESRIRDVDIAKEMMALTRANILAQASQYVLALHMMQAQFVLQLLKQ